MTEQHSKDDFHEIGRGCCGSVWALIDSDWVIKREDGDRHRSVLNDQVMHRRVIAADTENVLPVRIPSSHEILEANDEWWANNIEHFPVGSTVACRAYKQERIPAAPPLVRGILISRYCREELQAAARASKNNDDCLIRLYAGRRGDDQPRRFFNLRNYGLQVNQMEHLGLDVFTIAKTLADALAHCYWRARVDANDVEFVLAPATEPIRSSTTVFTIAGVDQEFVIWMLDYDCVREMSQDEEGVDQAVRAFYRNDPYFPRPHALRHTADDVRLWEAFKARFLESSRRILDEREAVMGDGAELPLKWVKQVEAESQRREQLSREPEQQY